ncbi:MAG: alpha/beta hydrolase [Hyphomicrobium sp.]
MLILKRAHLLLLIFGMLFISIAVWKLNGQSQNLIIKSLIIDQIPITLYEKSDGQRGPAVVIAHGFAGSQQLMQSFALSFALNGYVAITFDFAGHGRNPTPLAGSITQTDGATQFLVREVQKVAEFALSHGDGRLALLGHSMASDVVVRAASFNPNVLATITLSMFSPAVTSQTPRNLLVLVGDWEARLKKEALRAVNLFSDPEAARQDITYGSFAQGNARRASFIPYSEHVSVLYRSQSLREALAWLNTVFDFYGNAKPVIADRGGAIVLLFTGIVLLIWPMTGLLPVVSREALGTGRSGKIFWICLVVPTLLTPLLLRFVPTHILPILVADYLSVHFFVYGSLMALCLILTKKEKKITERTKISFRAFGGGVVLLILFFLFAFILPLNTYFTSFIPVTSRLPIICILFVGTLLFFLSDEWLTHGKSAIKGAPIFSKIAFLLSLMIAVSFDFKRLFFLILIIPVIVLFFVLFGLVSRLSYKTTGHPAVAALSNAFALAWSIGVTFPMLSG